MVASESLPNHRHVWRRQMPIRGAWRHVLPCQIMDLVTGIALHAGHTLPVGTSPNIHPMLVTIIALTREVSVGVAVHAARVMKNFHHGFKRSGGRSIIARSCAVNVFDLTVLTTGAESSSDEIGKDAAKHNDGCQD